MDDVSRIKHIFEINNHMVIASSNEKGLPWITPVAFAFDKDNSLYWTSSKESKHSLNIKIQSEIAIVIYSEKPAVDALYIEATACELSSKSELENAIRILETRRQPEKYKINSIDDVTRESHWRIYKATPKSMYFRQEVLIGGKSVTKRRKA